ncbi:hypothetical protein [Sinomicrobium weinanense]|uniref:Uncharacterized protein n=1 Tax=Sinomicrobium weinanense TaxID=2842200 RepID=A0A926JU67_9FLAO|nr:hypothetical protein [Sinomicrobium weinanense]MBC9797597.1 hypothetical protein [Sinomicrobium weinanense]MBU3123664.1 hypothetical protein [Sinomicrobium weinanense]
MKNFKYALASVILMFCACTTDDALYHDLNTQDIHHRTSVIPWNNTNPYDGVGERYREALDRYIDMNNIELSGKHTVRLADLGNKPYTITDDPLLALKEIITNSHLTLAAKTSLVDFIETILTLPHDPYEVLYTTITRYESLMTDHPRFSAEDKRVILTFTSLVRHSFYSYSTVDTNTEEEEPDDDWDNMVANMIDFILVALDENPEETISTANHFVQKNQFASKP